MYQQLFTRLGISGNNTSEVSQAVSMQGANAAQFDYVVISLAGTTPSLSFQLQQSNDLENWSSAGSAVSGVTTTGYALTTAITDIASGYIRLKITLTGTSPVAVVAAGVNTSQQ